LSKKIEFWCEPQLKDTIPAPCPASKFLPQWYKKMPADYSSDPLEAGTLKKCIPFRDALTTGYIIPLWQDLYFETHDNEESPAVSCSWKRSMNEAPGAVSTHKSEQVKQTPIVSKHYGDRPLKIHSPWIIKTPPGYSCIFTTPFNRFDLDFEIITGVVETDLYMDYINFPMIWKTKQYKGTLHQGMPLVQVIPFKRDSWDSCVEETNSGFNTVVDRTRVCIHSIFERGYKKFFWKKKTYR